MNEQIIALLLPPFHQTGSALWVSLFFSLSSPLMTQKHKQINMNTLQLLYVL